MLLEQLFVHFVDVVNNTTPPPMHVKLVGSELSHELALFATFVQSTNTQVLVNANVNLVDLDLNLLPLKILV